MTNEATTLIAEASQHLDHGEWAKLEAICYHGLKHYPNESEFDHLLGLALCQGERRTEGFRRLRRAVEAEPDNPARRHNLAVKLDEAKEPGAEELLRENIRLAPEFSHSWYALGLLLLNRKEAAEAEKALLQSLHYAPNQAEAWNNLGIVRKQLGRYEDAVAAYQRALSLSNSHAEALFNLASLLADQKRYAETLSLWQRYLSIRSDHAVAWNGYGVALFNSGGYAEAISAYRRSHELEPGNTQVMRNLAIALRYQWQLSEAESLLWEALQLEPNNINILNSLGAIVMDMRLPDKAMGILNYGLKLEPTRLELRTNLLFAMQYIEHFSRKDIARECANFELWHGKGAAQPDAYSNTKDLKRRLRIGYVSADFRQHSCAYFIEPLLRAHDKNTFEIYCYSNVEHSDEITEHLRNLANHWRNIRPLSDNEAFDLIRNDAIDILIDLSGHTFGNRLPLFALRPAPIQFSWLGYPDNTGLKAIDARITDDIIDPPSSTSRNNEPLIRLAAGMHCFNPPPPVPDISPLPALSKGFITFGSFNNISKLSPTTLQLWARLMHAVPGSRLLLKHGQLADAPLRTNLLRQFLMEGISPDRIDLLSYIDDRNRHLGSYHQIDIALDTFPYNGTTTTCEALWMGVPVLTLLGNRPATRVSASLLTRIGLNSFVANTPQHFVEFGSALASDLNNLATLRAGLRKRIQASPLGDVSLWIPPLEAAYRNAWEKWCQKSSTHSKSRRRKQQKIQALNAL